MRGTLDLRGHHGLGAVRGSGQQRGTAAPRRPRESDRRRGGGGARAERGAGAAPERGGAGRPLLPGEAAPPGPAGSCRPKPPGSPCRVPRRGRGRQPRPGSTAPGPGQPRRCGRAARGARGPGMPRGEAEAAGGTVAPPADAAVPPDSAGPGRPRHGAGECPGEETGEGPRGRRAGDAKPLPSTAILPASHSAPAADPAPAALPRPPPRPRGLRSSAAAAINLQRSLTAGGAAPRIPGKRSPGKRAPGQAPVFPAAGGAPGRLPCPWRHGEQHGARPWAERSGGAGYPHGACGGEEQCGHPAPGCFSPGFQDLRQADGSRISPTCPRPTPPHSLAGRRSLSAGKEKGTQSTGSYRSAAQPRVRPSAFVHLTHSDRSYNKSQKRRRSGSRAVASGPQKSYTKQPATLEICPRKQLWACALFSFVLRYQKGFEDFFFPSRSRHFFILSVSVILTDPQSMSYSTHQVMSLLKSRGQQQRD